jgi:hypothetical protein
MKIQDILKLENDKTEVYADNDTVYLILPRHNTNYSIMSMPKEKYDECINKAILKANKIAEDKDCFTRVEDVEVCTQNEYLGYMCCDFDVHVFDSKPVVTDLKVTFYDEVDSCFEVEIADNECLI